MSKFRVLIDMDGVLCDWERKFFTCLEIYESNCFLISFSLNFLIIIYYYI